MGTFAASSSEDDAPGPSPPLYPGTARGSMRDAWIPTRRGHLDSGRGAREVNTAEAGGPIGAVDFLKHLARDDCPLDGWTPISFDVENGHSPRFLGSKVVSVPPRNPCAAISDSTKSAQC